MSEMKPGDELAEWLFMLLAFSSVVGLIFCLIFTAFAAGHMTA